jgi:hypothetical protein
MIDLLIRIIPALVVIFKTDRREMDEQLAQARRCLDDAAERVRAARIDSPPPRVNPAPWYVPEQIHTNGGRAVKLPKKD